LILLVLCECRFCGHFSQALDFSGLPGGCWACINKVIHRNSELLETSFEINDLGRFPMLGMRKARQG
jgi:hypothetical protein